MAYSGRIKAAGGVTSQLCIMAVRRRMLCPPTCMQAADHSSAHPCNVFITSDRTARNNCLHGTCLPKCRTASSHSYVGSKPLLSRVYPPPSPSPPFSANTLLRQQMVHMHVCCCCTRKDQAATLLVEVGQPLPPSSPQSTPISTYGRRRRATDVMRAR